MKTKFFVNVEFGVTKIYTYPPGQEGQWTKRQIVADFVKGEEGEIAYAAFKRGIVHAPGAVSLYDLQTGKCLVGTVQELDSPGFDVSAFGQSDSMGV